MKKTLISILLSDILVSTFAFAQTINIVPRNPDEGSTGTVEDTNPEEVMIPKEITNEWLFEHKDWIKANFIQCPRGEPGDSGI